MNTDFMKSRLLKKHFCSNNDGKQSCDCFVEAERAVTEDVARQCWLECIAVGCGETEYSDAIATKFHLSERDK